MLLDMFQNYAVDSKTAKWVKNTNKDGFCKTMCHHNLIYG